MRKVRKINENSYICIRFLCRKATFNASRNNGMEKDIPKIDLPGEWVCGTDINIELLKLYTNYPVRLKCEMMVFCTEGEVEASINLNPIAVHANDLVILTPGSIFQIYRISGNLKIYFMGFSAQYIEQQNQSRALIEIIHLAWGRPVISLKPQGAKLMESYLQLLIQLYNGLAENLRREMADNLYADIRKCISLLYKSKSDAEPQPSSKSESLCRSFVRLVMQHYSQTRNVAWYAQRLGITHAYLSSIVKQTTGKTCAEIISSMVIMDAKSQLKSTQQPIQNIADSLNFANMSFFGKYFKRCVGMSPLEYRNNG